MIITGGIYKGRKILAPSEKITRPTLSKTRQGVFNTLYSLLGDFNNKTFLDVFGGSGIMGLEALSRGFKEVYTFEKNITAAQILKKNYISLGLKPNIKIGDSLKLIKQIDQSFDVIYIDPPYYSNIYEIIFNNLPNADIIIVEHTEPINITNFSLIKEKNYGDKLITFLKNK